MIVPFQDHEETKDSLQRLVVYVFIPLHPIKSRNEIACVRCESSIIWGNDILEITATLHECPFLPGEIRQPFAQHFSHV